MSNVVASEVLDWLESLSIQIAHLDEYRRRVEPQLASEFNVLRYARTDEMGLSQILADLLDPKGLHGQGPRFLGCFLKRYWPERASISSAAKVRTEVTTDRIAKRQRRIDIEVNFGDCVLGIENKPWAADQQAQIADYLEHLKKIGLPFKLLYLAGHEGRLPAEGSISGVDRHDREKDKTLGTTDYSDLREWLRDCLGCCENERVSMFLRDLDRFIASTFSHEAVDFESKMIVESAMASARGVHAAVQLNSPIASESRLLLLEQLEGQLQSEFTRATSESGLSGWSLDIPKPLHLQHAAVEVFRCPNSALKLALAFENANCGDCFFGVGRRCAEDNSYHEELQKSLDSEFGIGRRSPWWGWWRPFEHRFWWNDRTVWAGVVYGSLAKAIVARLIQMLEVADRPEFRRLFEQASLGTVAATVPRAVVKVADLTRGICERKSPRLFDHLLAVEAANWPLRRALAERVASRIRTLVEASSVLEGLGSQHSDLTQIYGGIGFRLRAQPTFQVHLEFQSWGCRNAIYGLCVDGLDGRSPEADDMRQRLTACGLAVGKHSPGWVWYRPHNTPNWFDQPSVAVSAWEGQLAQQAADLLLELTQAIAGLLERESQSDQAAGSASEAG